MNRNFWNGMAMGAAAGVMIGFMVMSMRRPMTPMERTKMAMGRTAKRAMKKARYAMNGMADRFSD